MKRSDRAAFFLFLNRHWKDLYVQALRSTGDEEQSFEQVCGLFALIWDRRRRLPGMDVGIQDYFLKIRQVLSRDGVASARKDRPDTALFQVDPHYPERWPGSLALGANGEK